MDDKPKIAVLGAGMVGLTLAKILKEHLDSNITIIADAWNKETVSNVAAGIFRPGSSFKGRTGEITKKWINHSWDYFNQILHSPDALEIGVMSVPTYIFSTDNSHVTKNHFLEGLVPIYRTATTDELKLGPEGTKFGSYFSTLKIETGRYLPYTEKIITKRGATIITKHIDSFASLSSIDNFDLVFNCSGLGAKFLCNDHDLVAIRGQVIKVHAPWVDTAYYADYDTYIIPGFDGVVTLGGVRNYDSYSLRYSRFDAESIMERCCELLPNLKNARVISHEVGLRPHRTPVRVESEIINGLKVVHCYGHGGYGIMTAPGTALNAIEIGLDMLKSNTRSKL